FFIRVQLSPVSMTEISTGLGGVFAEIELQYDDGETETVLTDETWLARLNRSYNKPYSFDGNIKADLWLNAKMQSSVRKIKDAPIPCLDYTTIYPDNMQKILVHAGETKEITLEFDKIYSASLALIIETDGCIIDADIIEFGDVHSGEEHITACEDMEYNGIEYHSMGAYTLKITNYGVKTTSILPAARFQRYPVTQSGKFNCSDEKLNDIYNVCKWTLEICRQTLHLDSPKHQEPLACTGDYYIESLMTAFTFGDMRLSELDIMRTADEIIHHNGKMFHTTYSLIWLQMILDVYKFTGNRELIIYCKDAIVTLLDRFSTYIGENGLVDNPPDYMFVDWVVADGHSMHHPPKALGQTVLNAFYYNGLVVAAELAEIIGENELKEKYSLNAEMHKKAFNEILFDSEKGLYFDGLNTPVEPSFWLPQNIEGRYFSKHANILSVLCGLCDGEKAKTIIEKVMSEKFITELQPYFMHYLFEALKKTGLYEKYAMNELRRWSVMTDACKKGLQEGWIKPQEDYSFDHSHAWGGTPAYQLPEAITGFKMLEAGFKKISLTPNLFDLEFADVSIPTPYGYIVCKLKKGEKPIIIIPDGIDCEVNYEKL
ncbi:MAG: hypothetical protein MJ120_05045, partial [Clostridia bacterium]|nr:hypothetical protein [Clostridia bacterium]